MHEMKLLVQALRPGIASGARGALSLVVGRHNNVGVSLRERRAEAILYGKIYRSHAGNSQHNWERYRLHENTALLPVEFVSRYFFLSITTIY